MSHSNTNLTINDYIHYNVRNISLYNRRVILNIAMLLRDSPIATTIRYMLLNITDNIDRGFFLSEMCKLQYNYDEKLKLANAMQNRYINDRLEKMEENIMYRINAKIEEEFDKFYNTLGIVTDTE